MLKVAKHILLHYYFGGLFYYFSFTKMHGCGGQAMIYQCEAAAPNSSQMAGQTTLPSPGWTASLLQTVTFSNAPPII